MAADQARRLDPGLAAKYHRLMVTAGKHHTSALCHIAAALLTRTVACWRNRQPYQLRNLDGTRSPATKPGRSSPTTTPSPPPCAPPLQHPDGPTKSEVAARSIDRPGQQPR